jgi:predicted  nucleic acid-binding Zn-ribbon protein
MSKNGYVTLREFDVSTVRLEERINSIEKKTDINNDSIIKLAMDVGEIKKHFNDEMRTTVKQQINKESYKMNLKKGIYIVLLSGLISFIVAMAIK